MNPLRRALSAALALAVRTRNRVTRQAPRLILTYHKVGDGPDAVPAGAFSAQIRRALAAGFEIVPLSRMVAWVKHGLDLPGRALSLTFDDGLADTARVAGPILREHGISATVFPVLDFLGGPRRYASVRTGGFLLEDDGDPRTVPYDYMTWDELDRWVEAGGEVGGHTLSHPFLGEANEATGLGEIRGCRERLAARYGSPPGVFCYPYGDDPGRAGTWVRQSGFEAAVTSHEGVVERASDLFHLRRLPAPPNAGRDFDDLLHGIFLWRRRLREALPGR